MKKVDAGTVARRRSEITTIWEESITLKKGEALEVPYTQAPAISQGLNAIRAYGHRNLRMRIIAGEKKCWLIRD